MHQRNVVVLTGRLAADPELRYLDNGTPVASFAVAINRPVLKPDSQFDSTLDGFFDCELFGGQAVTLAETCAKGTEVQLSGSLRQNKFKTRGDNARTISRTVVRVGSASRVLEVAREPEAPEPQPA